MARCAICGKELSPLDNTTYYYDATGARVEVHTACLKTVQSSSVMQPAGPTMYPVEAEADPDATPEAAANVRPLTTYLLVGGSVVLGLLLIAAVLSGER